MKSNSDIFDVILLIIISFLIARHLAYHNNDVKCEEATVSEEVVGNYYDRDTGQCKAFYGEVKIIKID